MPVFVAAEKSVYRARSLLQLTVFGFLAVVTLLIIALLISARQLDQLAEQSRAATSEAAEAMRLSRRLIEHSGALERNARQFIVLRDGTLLDVYADRRGEFVDTLVRLDSLLANPSVADSAVRLLQQEEQAYRALLDPGTSQQMEAEYPPLLESAYALSSATSSWVDDQAGQLQQQTRETQRSLNLRTLFLVASALALAALFVTLIIRPLRQVDRAIRGLGRGAYDAAIHVEGPRDLQQLGERLDWLRERLDTLEQQRNAFLRHVSHELKTPLAAMQESAALLGEGIVGPVNERQAEIVAILDKNCQRLLILIEDLLRYNASSFEVLETMPQPIELAALADQVVSNQELALRSADLALEKELDRVTVQGDTEQIRVVLDNLLSNAIKFSPSGGVIRLTVRREDEWAAVAVEDEGPGVPPADREKVFSAFFQGKQQPRKGYHGSGLGLAIARDYARTNGGELTLEPIGRGARFLLRLPLERRKRAGQTPAAKESQ